MRILLAASLISIVIEVSTSNDDHRPTAWIEGFAIFVAVMVCANVTAMNVQLSSINFFLRTIKRRNNFNN